MPTYNYHCPFCDWDYERTCKIAQRREQRCGMCNQLLELRICTPVPIKVVGKAVEGGGPDRFTADALGIPLKELPSGLRTKR